MAQVTATPADVTLSYGTFSTSGSATISWTTPTVPSGATITSVKLTGTVTATNTNTTAIKLNDQSLTVSTSGAAFTIDLGTDNSKTSLSASATKSNRFSSSSVKFTNMTYTVEYTEPTYTVIFKDEDGNVLKTVTDATKSDRLSYIEPDTAKEGYTFIGWFDSDDKYIDSVNGDLTLIAKYAENPTITVQQNDGGSITYNGTTYRGDFSFVIKYRNIAEFEIAADDGYIIGYYIDNDPNDPNNSYKWIHGGKTFSLSYECSRPMTFIVKFVKEDTKCSVTFKDYDGSILKSISDVPVKTYPNTLKPDDPTREGYKFTGWDPEIGYMIVEDTVYTAQYQECATLTIKQNRGGYFICDGDTTKYEGDQIFTFDDRIDMDITIYPKEGYCTMYTIQKDDGFGEEGFMDEIESTGSFGTGWQNIGTNSFLQIEYARISTLNNENIIVNGKYVREAYLGNKPLKIYRGDDRIL